MKGRFESGIGECFRERRHYQRASLYVQLVRIGRKEIINYALDLVVGDTIGQEERKRGRIVMRSKRGGFGESIKIAEKQTNGVGLVIG